MASKHESDFRRSRRWSATVRGVLSRRRVLNIGAMSVTAAAFGPTALAQSVIGSGGGGTRFRRIRTQFIAALGNPDATSGSNAHQWGLWRVDPGPRGVWLNRYDSLIANGGVAPAGWKFDSSDWWLEEHGLIMESPDFPLSAGQYLVTGDREVTTVLTVHAEEAGGSQRWELADGATIYDVTHLRCRSARYTPATNGVLCSPSKASRGDFPVTPGAEMPPVGDCNKQDYAVLFVIGVAQT
ncbi:MAG: hypothetical protein OEQ25_08150 [Gammaproteobacteria bacterium]|nr:hypothetical protein [Gammaproteobacteria bacterium]